MSYANITDIPSRIVCIDWPDVEEVAVSPCTSGGDGSAGAYQQILVRASHHVGLFRLLPPLSHSTSRVSHASQVEGDGGRSNHDCLPLLVPEVVLPQPHRHITSACALTPASAAITTTHSPSLSSSFAFAVGDSASMLTIVKGKGGAKPTRLDGGGSSTTCSNIFLGNSWDTLTQAAGTSTNRVVALLPSSTDGSYLLAQREFDAVSVGDSKGSSSSSGGATGGSDGPVVWVASLEQELAWSVPLSVRPPPSLSLTGADLSLYSHSSSLFPYSRNDKERKYRRAFKLRPQLFDLRHNLATSSALSEPSPVGTAMTTMTSVFAAAYPQWISLHLTSTAAAVATFTLPNSSSALSRQQRPISSGSGSVYALWHVLSVSRMETGGGHQYAVSATVEDGEGERNDLYIGCFDDRRGDVPVWWERCSSCSSSSSSRFSDGALGSVRPVESAKAEGIMKEEKPEEEEVGSVQTSTGGGAIHLPTVQWGSAGAAAATKRVHVCSLGSGSLTIYNSDEPHSLVSVRYHAEPDAPAVLHRLAVPREALGGVPLRSRNIGAGAATGTNLVAVKALSYWEGVLYYFVSPQCTQNV